MNNIIGIIRADEILSILLYASLAGIGASLAVSQHLHKWPLLSIQLSILITTMIYPYFCDLILYMSGELENIFNYENSIISGNIAYPIILAAPFPACVLTNLAAVLYYEKKVVKIKENFEEEPGEHKSWFTRRNFVSAAICLIVFYFAAISIDYKKEDFSSFSAYAFLSLRLLAGLIFSAGLGLISSVIVYGMHRLLFKIEKGEID